MAYQRRFPSREEQEPTRAFRPAQDAYPPEDAYPPQEAYPPEDAYPPADAYPPEDAYAPQDGYLPPEQAQEPSEDHWDAAEDDEEGEWADDLDALDVKPPKPHPHSIFKPATKKPNFAICVAVNVVRILALLVVLVQSAVKRTRPFRIPKSTPTLNWSLRSHFRKGAAGRSIL